MKTTKEMMKLARQRGEKEVEPKTPKELIEKVDKEFERIGKLKKDMPLDNWITSQLKRNLELHDAFSQGLVQMQEACSREIDKSILKYQKGKLKDSNFEPEDRATAMVVLEVLKQKIKEDAEDNLGEQK